MARPGSQTGRETWRRGTSIASSTPAPRQYVWTPACGANRPGTAAGTVQDVTCGAATQCDGGAILMALWSAPAGTNTWARVRNQCMTTAQAVTAGAAVVIPTVTLEDVRRLNLPAGRANVEPSDGHVALNIPTNVYAEAAPVTRQLNLLGFDITVEATPVSYTWEFGDGSTLGPTKDAGAPYPAMTTTHTYGQPGNYGVTLTTAYTARYEVAGLGFQDIAGQVEVRSAAVPLTAHEGSTVLIR